MNTSFHSRCCPFLQNQEKKIQLYTMTNTDHSQIQSWECGFHEQTSSGVNQRAISFLADSTESDPWQIFLPTSMQKSPLMVPGAELRGLVSPSIFLPVTTTPLPSQTMHTTGPESMYLMSLGKNGFSDKSEQCFFRSSSEGRVCFRALRKNPRFSKREMISPTSPLWTPSGLTMMQVLSSAIVEYFKSIIIKSLGSQDLNQNLSMPIIVMINTLLFSLIPIVSSELSFNIPHKHIPIIKIPQFFIQTSNPHH